MEKNMIEFMVVEKKSDGSVQGFGRKSFRVTPRVGEFVTMEDEEGVSHAYKVIGVIHPLEPASTSGDLYLKYVGKINDLQKQLG